MRRLSFLAVCLFGLTGIAVAGQFVPGVAVSDAGKIADEKRQEFFAYFIPAGSASESTSAEVSKHLSGAAKAKANLAVFGPDYALNAKILKGALQGAAKGSLDGATILYVNGGEDVEELKSLATVAGAAFRSTAYSAQ
jgi:hypothetical protein